MVPTTAKAVKKYKGGLTLRELIMVIALGGVGIALAIRGVHFAFAVYQTQRVDTTVNTLNTALSTYKSLGGDTVDWFLKDKETRVQLQERVLEILRKGVDVGGQERQLIARAESYNPKELNSVGTGPSFVFVREVPVPAPPVWNKTEVIVGETLAPVTVHYGVLSYTDAYTLTILRKPDWLVQKDGYLEGTPKDAGTYTVDFSASNDQGVSKFTQEINILQGKPVFTSTLELSTFAGIPITHPMTTTNGPCSFFAEGLPAGIVLLENGTLTGQTEIWGIYPVKVTFRNSRYEDNISLKLKVIASAPNILVDDTAFGYVDSYMEIAIKTDKAAALTVTSLPDGLTWEADTQKIVGEPKQVGTYTVDISAKNKFGGDTKSISIAILSLKNSATQETTFGNISIVGISTENLVKLDAMATISQNFGTGGKDITSIGLFPVGLTHPVNVILAYSIDGRTWTGIAQLPLQPIEQEQYFAITPLGNIQYWQLIFQDAVQLAAVEFGVHVSKQPKPKITTGCIELRGYVGVPVKTTINADQPVIFTSKNLPAGFILHDKLGIMGGVPQAAGDYLVEVQGSNDAGSGFGGVHLKIAASRSTKE